MKLILEGWREYLNEAIQMPMFPDPEDRWDQLGGKENIYNSFVGRRMGEEERREIEAKVINMPQEEFDELLTQINRTIEYQSREIYYGKIPDEAASAIRLWQVDKWKDN